MTVGCPAWNGTSLLQGSGILWKGRKRASVRPREGLTEWCLSSKTRPLHAWTLNSYDYLHKTYTRPGPSAFHHGGIKHPVGFIPPWVTVIRRERHFLNPTSLKALLIFVFVCLQCLMEAKLVLHFLCMDDINSRFSPFHLLELQTLYHYP